MATGGDAIGIFDSGVGGLTVLHALLEALPHEDLVYLGDTGRYPYGTKSAETVTRYSVENVDFLIARGIKLLVVACNTASSVALAARGLARRQGAGSTSFFVTDVPDRFIRIGQRFLGARLESAVRIER